MRQQLGLVDEARREDALHAVEGLAAQPDEFVFLETKRADVVELLSKLLDGDDIGEPHIFGAIIQTNGNLDLLVFLDDQLPHENLVKIVVEQATFARSVECSVGKVCLITFSFRCSLTHFYSN